MPRIKTKPKQTLNITETTASLGILSEMWSFCYIRKEGCYENLT